MRKIKLRIIGERDECEDLLKVLRTTGRVKRVRRIHRQVGERVYSRTFGSASTVFYIELTKKNKCQEKGISAHILIQTEESS